MMKQSLTDHPDQRQSKQASWDHAIPHRTKPGYLVNLGWLEPFRNKSGQTKYAGSTEDQTEPKWDGLVARTKKTQVRLKGLNRDTPKIVV